ncbi:MAG: phage Gp37/Gp68 family protein [Pseudomonadota bacterium]
MSAKTGIQWCDSTFNPVIGCTKISPGCDGCYAAAQDKFRKWTPEGWGGPRKRTSVSNWKEPVKWNSGQFYQCSHCGMRGTASAFANPCAHGRGGVHWLQAARRRVFCASLADVFDNQWDPQWRADLFDLIAQTPNLDWLLLTKRIGNAKPMINEAISRLRLGGWKQMPWPWPNVWIGATVVNQEEADRDIPKLLAINAYVRFLSMEPLLGRVDLCEHLGMWWNQTMGCFESTGPTFNSKGPTGQQHPGIGWVIAGGESGPGARPSQPEWYRSLRGQCDGASVPFLFKQWGEFAPLTAFPPSFGTDAARIVASHDGGPAMYRAGKKAAGRLLDGVEHNGFPM